MYIVSTIVDIQEIRLIIILIQFMKTILSIEKQIRRWFKAPVSSEACVRIPPLPSSVCSFCFLVAELDISYYVSSALVDGLIAKGKKWTGNSTRKFVPNRSTWPFA